MERQRLLAQAVAMEHGGGDARAGLVVAPRATTCVSGETEAGPAHWFICKAPVPEHRPRGGSADGPHWKRFCRRALLPIGVQKALFCESFSLLLSHYPGKMVTLAVQSVFTMETS